MMAIPHTTGRAMKRGAAPELAVGAYMLLLSALFLAPFILNPLTRQNDVFLANLFLGPLLYVTGGALLAGGLAGLGLPRWAALTLALATPLSLLATIGAVTLWAVDGIAAMARVALTGAVALLVASVGAAAWSHHWRIWAEAMALAVGGAGIVWLVSSLAGSRYLAFGVSASNLPPYLDLPVGLVSIALAAVIVAAAWTLGQRQR